MGSDKIDPRFDPHFQRGHEDDPTAVLRELGEPLEAASAERTPRGRNPWMAVLWILAIVLLSFGLSAAFISNSMMLAGNFNSVSEYYVIPKTLESVAPWFVAVGLASVVGVVFMHAVRWER